MLGALLVVVALLLVIALKGGSNSNAAGSRTASSTPAHDDLRVTSQGFTQLSANFREQRYVTYAAVVTNPDPSLVATGVAVRLEFINTAGVVVKVENPTPFAIGPGKAVAVAGTDDPGGIVTGMQVRAKADVWQSRRSVGSFTFTDTTTQRVLGGVQTRTTLHSAYESPRKLVLVAAVYYDPAGNVAGGTSTYVQYVSAGSRVPVVLLTFTAPPDVARTEVFAASLASSSRE